MHILKNGQNYFNPLSTNPTEWSNTLKQFVESLLINCLSVFDHFVKLALKGLKISQCEQDERVNSFSHEFGENLIYTCAVSRTSRTLEIQIISKTCQKTQEVRITLQVKVEGFMNLGLLSQFQKKYMRFKNRIKNRAC